MVTKKLTTIDDLRPAPYNPRRIDKKAATALGKSIGDFGDLSGLVWNKRTGHLVCGHQRLDQLKECGAQLIDGDVVIDGGERFPVRVVDWPASKEKAANVTANNPHIGGEFTDGLGDILGDIKLAIGDEDFMGLRLDVLIDDPNIPEIDLGSGDVEEKPALLRIAVFVPAAEKKKIKSSLNEWVDAHGGHMVECDHEDCNLSVRDINTHSWARRRKELNSASVQRRKIHGSESQDDTGG